MLDPPYECIANKWMFLYADEKEEGILGSILLPSFHISKCAEDDHINRKYAFKVSVCFFFLLTS